MTVGDFSVVATDLALRVAYKPWAQGDMGTSSQGGRWGVKVAPKVAHLCSGEGDESLLEAFDATETSDDQREVAKRNLAQAGMDIWSSADNVANDLLFGFKADGQMTLPSKLGTIKVQFQGEWAEGELSIFAHAESTLFNVKAVMIFGLRMTPKGLPAPSAAEKAYFNKKRGDDEEAPAQKDTNENAGYSSSASTSSSSATARAPKKPEEKKLELLQTGNAVYSSKAGDAVKVSGQHAALATCVLHPSAPCPQYCCSPPHL